MSRFNIAQAFLAVGITTSCNDKPSAMAQAMPDCCFNGATEACIITTIADVLKRDKWAS